MLFFDPTHRKMLVKPRETHYNLFQVQIQISVWSFIIRGLMGAECFSNTFLQYFGGCRLRCVFWCPPAWKGGALANLLLDSLVSREEELKKIIKEKKAAVKRGPKGFLKTGFRRGRYYEYYWRQKAGERYRFIPKKNSKFAASLAQRDYDLQVLRAAKKEQELISELIKMHTPDAIDAAYTRSAAARKVLIRPVWPSDEEFREEWLKQDSCQKGFADDAPEYYTVNGERVRSKTEILIANSLLKLGVAYLYECSLLLAGFGTVHPDFSVLDLKNRRTILWEHLGRMDDPDYVERAVRRINAYLKNGYVIGETLILTFETGKQPISTVQIENLIKHYFL